MMHWRRFELGYVVLDWWILHKLAQMVAGIAICGALYHESAKEFQEFQHPTTPESVIY